MKVRILSLAIALIALFCFNNAFAQGGNPKWTKGPCLSGTTISGMATGLSTGPLYLRITGKFDCVNKGGNVPSSDNWSDLDIIVPAVQKGSGGNLKLTAEINICPKSPKWTTYLENVVVTLYDNASGSEPPIIGPTSVSSSCN
jgi:hypothetical protein